MEIIERKRSGVLDKLGGEFVAGSEVGHSREEVQEFKKFKEEESGARIQEPGGQGLGVGGTESVSSNASSILSGYRF
jgi:hypothetical protein